MRLGQQLKVRKFEHGGTAAENNCVHEQGGVWTGSTCDMSQAAGHEMTNVATQSGSQFENLAGFQTGEGNQEAMGTYLQETYGLQDPEAYLSSFEAYDPYKEQQLKEHLTNTEVSYTMLVEMIENLMSKE